MHHVVGFGGPAEAGGEVRRGSLSESGKESGLNSEPRQHPGGVRRIEDASARPPHPKSLCPAGGVAQVLCEFLCWIFARLSRGFFSPNVTKFEPKYTPKWL